MVGPQRRRGQSVTKEFTICTENSLTIFLKSIWQKTETGVKALIVQIKACVNHKSDTTKVGDRNKKNIYVQVLKQQKGLTIKYG